MFRVLGSLNPIQSHSIKKLKKLKKIKNQLLFPHLRLYNTQ